MAGWGNLSRSLCMHVHVGHATGLTWGYQRCPMQNGVCKRLQAKLRCEILGVREQPSLSS